MNTEKNNPNLLILYPSVKLLPARQLATVRSSLSFILTIQRLNIQHQFILVYKCLIAPFKFLCVNCGWNEKSEE